ncbi:MAG: hypothetical protein PHW62_07470 [Candidatus Ratteibacteria bacterium]|nr:hypothetical protein [Candidatus Ratteibacteria bacterium]
MKQKERKYKIGIAGLGMVGGALRRYFEKKDRYDLFLYDKFKKIGSINNLNQANYIYIAVPTPNFKTNKNDTSAIDGVISKLKYCKVVIIKSTVLPGTTDMFQEKYSIHKILFNPEFLTEETADNDMGYPDRQIIGYTKQSQDVAGDVLQQLPLAPFNRIVPAKEAEMIKYYGNAWFSCKVVFANQMYDYCRRKGINYGSVMDGVAADKRIGRTHLKIFHKGYRGYGGKCLPKDTRALIDDADKSGVDLRLLKVVEKINNKYRKEQEYEKDR